MSQQDKPQPGRPPQDKGVPKGVRGPRGPQSSAPQPSRQPARRRRPSPLASPSSYADTRRGRFERFSYPLLARLHALPRWLVIVLPGVLLLLGLILSGPWAWVGALLLLVLWVFIGWLTALSWPAISPGQRVFRAVVLIAMLGVIVLKFRGRF
jgi:hypothetical protein